jgi:glyoxylase-like metal-dependent hydrolase (beta-lactamase superfamily II)
MPQPSSPPGLFLLSPSLTVLKTFDTALKAELWSTAILHRDKLLLIDPLTDEGSAPAALIVTNENHFRAAPALAARTAAPIYAHHSIAGQARPLVGGSSLDGLLSVIEIDGAPLGEIALLDPQEGGTLIIGDALINFEPHGFQLLPAKYCRDQKTMRRSLRQLLDIRYERIVFAHGAPLAVKAHERLAALLAL